jgi:hypothetical protein
VRRLCSSLARTTEAARIIRLALATRYETAIRNRSALAVLIGHSGTQIGRPRSAARRVCNGRFVETRADGKFARSAPHRLTRDDIRHRVGTLVTCIELTSA